MDMAQYSSLWNFQISANQNMVLYLKTLLNIIFPCRTFVECCVDCNLKFVSYNYVVIIKSNTDSPAKFIGFPQIFPLIRQSKHSLAGSWKANVARSWSIELVFLVGWTDSSFIRGISSWILSHISKSLIELKSRFILKQKMNQVFGKKYTNCSFLYCEASNRFESQTFRNPMNP